MTVELTFESDDELMRQTALELATDESWDRLMGLGVTWPVLPTRLVVDNVTIFALPEVAVLALAYDLPIYLRVAWEQESADCPIWEYSGLRIHRTGDRLCLKLRVAPDIGCAPLHELLGAATQFAQNVRDYVLKWLPELAEDPGWGEWLRERGNPPDVQDHMSST